MHDSSRGMRRREGRDEREENFMIHFEGKTHCYIYSIGLGQKVLSDYLKCKI